MINPLGHRTLILALPLLVSIGLSTPYESTAREGSSPLDAEIRKAT